jgi:hypothetical protein
MSRTAFLPAIILLAGIARGDESQAAQSSRDAVEALKSYLNAESAKWPALAEQPFASVPLTRVDCESARRLLWEDHVRSIKQTRADEMNAKKIVDGKLEMPFDYRIFGDNPQNGRSLFISMHGGGNTPKAVNDQQWENQKRLYKPAEGVYLAPRAPTDHWNLWHEPHIDRMFARLIEDLIVFENVDPNRVYLMGYSAGGDGVYQLAPRMADRWAAASMMAGHPNDASPLGLRNLPFAINVGENDSGYKRNQVAQEWGKKLDDLQKADPQGYVHLVHLHAGKGHWMDREDAEALPWMAQYTRDPFPKKVVWKQASTTHERFYWLAVAAGRAKSGSEVVASFEGQAVTIQSAKGVEKLIVRVNDAMVDQGKPISIKFEAKEIFSRVLPRTISNLVATLNDRGDRAAIFSGQIEVNLSSN